MKTIGNTAVISSFVVSVAPHSLLDRGGGASAVSVPSRFPLAGGCYDDVKSVIGVQNGGCCNVRGCCTLFGFVSET